MHELNRAYSRNLLLPRQAVFFPSCRHGVPIFDQAFQETACGLTRFKFTPFEKAADSCRRLISYIYRLWYKSAIC
jgi:hypothetical protein